MGTFMPGATSKLKLEKNKIYAGVLCTQDNENHKELPFTQLDKQTFEFML